MKRAWRFLQLTVILASPIRWSSSRNLNPFLLCSGDASPRSTAVTRPHQTSAGGLCSLVRFWWTHSRTYCITDQILRTSSRLSNARHYIAFPYRLSPRWTLASYWVLPLQTTRGHLSWWNPSPRSLWEACWNYGLSQAAFWSLSQTHSLSFKSSFALLLWASRQPRWAHRSILKWTSKVGARWAGGPSAFAHIGPPHPLS